jgi:uncharacterized protein YdhG (YjbR/CyaY superfamily)
VLEWIGFSRLSMEAGAMRSKASTVEEYLSELPPARRSAIQMVRRIILEHLPRGYEEIMNWGMITYQVPLERYPRAYNRKPLMYAALASQKNHMALYLTIAYIDEQYRQRFIEEYRTTGKRLDMAKSCVRFRKIEDLPLALIGKTISSFDVSPFIEKFEAARKSGAKI